MRPIRQKKRDDPIWGARPVRRPHGADNDGTQTSLRPGGVTSPDGHDLHQTGSIISKTPGERFLCRGPANRGSISTPIGSVSAAAHRRLQTVDGWADMLGRGETGGPPPVQKTTRPGFRMCPRSRGDTGGTACDAVMVDGVNHGTNRPDLINAQPSTRVWPKNQHAFKKAKRGVRGHRNKIIMTVKKARRTILRRWRCQRRNQSGSSYVV